MSLSHHPGYESDERTSVSDLRKIVADFVHERDWEVFHNPKNLAMSIAIEAAELMEHFQWLGQDESQDLASQVGPETAIAEEIADVLAYTLALANVLELDISQALRLKMQKNAVKYPVQASRGKWKRPQ